MTKFEQIKRNTISYYEKRLEEINIELSKQETMSINEYIESNIRKTDHDEYIFAFSQDPYQYISMRNKEALIEMVKIFLSQEVGEE